MIIHNVINQSSPKPVSQASNEREMSSNEARPEPTQWGETKVIGTDDSPKETMPEAPSKEAFDIPTSEEAYNLMIDPFSTVALAKWEVDEAI